jgi:hypothetical protein
LHLLDHVVIQALVVVEDQRLGKALLAVPPDRCAVE